MAEFDEAGARRIVRAVRAVEGMPRDATRGRGRGMLLGNVLLPVILLEDLTETDWAWGLIQVPTDPTDVDDVTFTTQDSSRQKRIYPWAMEGAVLEAGKRCLCFPYAGRLYCATPEGCLTEVEE